MARASCAPEVAPEEVTFFHAHRTPLPSNVFFFPLPACHCLSRRRRRRRRRQRIFVGDRTVHEDRARNASRAATGGGGVAGTRILVVHRSDASGGRRMVKNHGAMLAAIRAAFPSAHVTGNHSLSFSPSLSLSLYT